jgi:GNAT superfamily N-acetyltransferase
MSGEGGKSAMQNLSLEDIPPERLDEAAGENLALHMGWVQQRTPGMRVEADAHLTLIDSGLACDTFNIVCRTRLPEESLRERIAEAVGYFRAVRRPFCWWVGPSDRPLYLGQALKEAGLAEKESEAAMTADLYAIRKADPLPPGLRIERARSPEQLRDFAFVLAANWTPPDPDAPRFFVAAAPVLLQPGCPMWLYVGYQDGEPVAICELTEGGGVVGLYNVCTLEAHRRKGIASALLMHSLREARERGWKTAVLQASVYGQGAYARLGFRVTGRFTEYAPL